MPLYEYECEACGHRFEQIRKFSDGPLSECPVCKGSLRKLLSSPAIQFKGSGWYITDYARKGGPPAPSNGNGVESTKTTKDGADKKDGDKKDADKKADKKADTASKSGSSSGSSSSSSE